MVIIHHKAMRRDLHLPRDTCILYHTAKSRECSAYQSIRRDWALGARPPRQQNLALGERKRGCRPKDDKRICAGMVATANPVNHLGCGAV